MSLLDDLKAQMAIINDQPPCPRAILVSHLVPYGELYRQWDTSGRLFVWVNRGQVADLPHVRWQGIDIAVDDIAPRGAPFGIPVVVA